MTRLLAVAAVVLGSLVVPATRGSGAEVVELTIHNSRFDRRVITIPAGREVTFVVRNTDPIFHELIVGTRSVHRRHEAGTEPYHAPKPGEVTVPPNSTRQTTYRAPADRPVTFACHLPGHVAYGMHGVVRVTP